MAEIKVSELPEASQINDDDLIMIVQSGTNKKITKDNSLNPLVEGKQDTLVSGTNIKTINNTSLLGSGDISIEGTEPKNSYSTSTQDAYSCNYVNDTNSYLKEETDTGQTYYDGKKIYRKLLTGTSVSGSVVTLQAGLSNINTITKLYGVYGNDYPIPYATVNTSFIIEMYRNGQNINVVFGNSISSNVAFRVIVEYTKN